MRMLLAGVVLGTMLLASVAAAAGNPPPVRVIHTTGTLEGFAIGGQRVAYDLRGSPACNKVLVRDLRTGKTTRVSGTQTCSADTTSTGAGVRELAVAGDRSSWIVNHGGNTESNDYLYTASLPRPKERRLAAASRFGDIDRILAGGWIGNLAGSGNLLAVNRWSTDKGGTVTRSGVDVIVGTKLRRVVSSQKQILAQAVDSGRIAVLYADGNVEIYDANGKRLRSFKPVSATEIALRGDYLLLLTESKTVEIYNARTGADVRSWPLEGRKPGSLDLYGGVATYTAYPEGTFRSFNIHAVQLKTGKDVVVATGNYELLRSAELEPAGLLYARDRHNLVLIPFARVLAAVS
jgi:hypothetical protein